MTTVNQFPAWEAEGLCLSEGATGGVLRSSDVQIVVYSEPVEPP